VHATPTAGSACIDLAHFREFGWVRVPTVVPPSLCHSLVEVLAREFGVSVHDRSGWDAYGGEWADLLPVWGHQAQWDIRQHPSLHRAWAELWNTDALWVSLDSCRFTPPWRPGYAEPYGLHWDRAPWDPDVTMLQGVLALTDTAVGQGGFRCVPSLYRNRGRWPKAPTIDADGDKNWLASVEENEILTVPAAAGDLIVWDYRLPHGNSKNTSTTPRIAFYVAMYPTLDERLRDAAIESWQTGRCVPWWRSRAGYDRVEPWSPATLTDLGKRLLGLDAWPADSAHHGNDRET
jgi:Phytanoyl-CoA dioxygenase (PhyH)